MADDFRERPADPGFAWPVAIVLGAAAIAGGFAGYNDGAVRAGDPPLAPWVGPVVAIGVAAVLLALFIRRHRAALLRWSPRKRVYAISLFSSLGLGAVLAMTLQAGEGSLTGNDPLSPMLAVSLSLLWVLGLGVASYFYMRSVDDHERHAYYLASVWGFHAFAAACPLWWVLARARLAPPVDAMTLFLFSIAVNLAAYLWFKYR